MNLSEAPPKGNPLDSFVTQGGELRLSSQGQLELLQAVMSRGAKFRTTVRGISMFPFIRDEDVLTISPAAGWRPRIGNVVAFIQPDSGRRLVVHRIVDRREEGWLVRGDNCTEPDGIIYQNDLIGYVTGIERRGRKVRLGLDYTGAWIAFLNRGQIMTRIRSFLYMLLRAVFAGLHLLQSMTVYRRLTRRFAAGISIAEAGTRDMQLVQKRLNPAGPYTACENNPDVVNFVAKRGSSFAGFIQIVHDPDAHAPWSGYWLSLIQVRTLYRGMGVGGALIRRVLEEAAVRGAGELRVAVQDDDRQAMGLLRHLGFESIDIPGLEPLLEKEKNKTGQRRFVMQKNIKESI